MNEKEMEFQFAAFQARMEAKRLRPRDSRGKLLPKDSRNRFIHDFAVRREPLGRHNEAELWVVPRADREEMLQAQKILAAAGLPDRDFYDPDALNGYVAFPKRRAPRFSPKVQALLDFIPVHGGITYMRKDSFAAVWGFDTFHCNSMKVDRTNPDWIATQCHVLFVGLQVAEKLAKEFVNEPGRDRRIELLEKVYEIFPHAEGMNEDLGFGGLLRVLSGDI